MVVSQRIKSLRKEQGFTQKNLAKTVGVKHNTVCNYEKGNSVPDLETAIKLAKAFCCSMDYLIGLTDNRFRERRIIKTSQFTLIKYQTADGQVHTLLIPKHLAVKRLIVTENGSFYKIPNTENSDVKYIKIDEYMEKI